MKVGTGKSPTQGQLVSFSLELDEQMDSLFLHLQNKKKNMCPELDHFVLRKLPNIRVSEESELARLGCSKKLLTFCYEEQPCLL